MEALAIFQLVTARFGEVAFDFQPAVGADTIPKEGARESSFRVKGEFVLPVMTFLRDDQALRFDFLQNLTAVDWPQRAELQVIYHLHSYPHRHEAVVKVDLPRDNPRLPSVSGLWGCANWLEREQFDLLGIVYEGHPDLRRLLLPDDWIGHPMRKDYQEAAAYRGMPTSRPSALDLLLAYDRAQNPGGAQVVGPKPDKHG